MIYLFLSILSSTSLVLIFKWFQKMNINSFQAIIVNYCVAGSLGLFFSNSAKGLGQVPNQDWFILAVILGVLFISLFNLIAFTTQKLGIAVATVSNKMSVIIPVIVAVILYNDSMPWIKILGIFMALISVLLISFKPREQVDEQKHLWFVPLILFLGSGLLDSIIKYAQERLLPIEDQELFLSSVFITAASIGICILIFLLIQRKAHVSGMNVLGGIILGIPNYASMYFLIKALEIEGLQSSVVFPVNNIGIVAASAIGGFWLFGERQNARKFSGIILAIVAITIIALSS